MFRYILAFCVLTVLHTFAPAMAAVSASSGTSTRATISRVAPTENAVSDSGQSSSRTSSSRTNASRVVSGRGDTTTANRAVNARNVSGRSAADTRARTTTRAVAGRGTNTTARSTASRTSASSSRAAVSRAATTTASRAATTNAARSAKSSINRAAVTSKATVPSRTTSRATNARSRASISSALRIGARTTPTSTTQISEVDTGTATTGTSVSDMDELAQTTDFCKAQYMQCMDQFCNVLDDSQGRCSCSKNISNYAESEAILKAATEELRDVAQQVQYLGLSSDQVASLFTQTEGELQLSQSTDNSKINSSLNKLRDMIVEVKTGAPSSTSESTTSGLNFDMSGLLDFSFDSVGFDLGALFGNTKTNVASISNYRGEQLYKIATQRCKTAVLTSCQAQGVDTSIITNAYDLEIDKQCLVYERNLTEQNDEMVETIRNARNVLQRGRLMVAQRKNAYDLRECITELDACMQDDFVCGSDYENCLDPSGKYIVDGQVVVGTMPGVPGGGITASTSSVGGLYATWNYDSGNAWGNGRVAEYVDSYLDGKYPTSGLEYMANYLHNKIGYIEEGKAFGMCSGVLNQCQDYTFVDGEYAPDNQVIRQYLERTLVKIKSGQDSVLNDYAEDCLSDVSECLSENSYNSSTSTTTTNPSQIAINACKSVINSCRNITGFSTATDTAVNCWLDTAFGYTLVKDDSVCVEESVTQCNGRGEVLTSAGSCICDIGANFTGMAGACECKSGYKLSNNACVLDQQPVNPGNPNLSNQKVTINYNLNGATGGTVQSHQCNSGSACELSDDLGFGVFRAGYVFQGWSTNQYATTGAYSINIPSNPSSTTITVYAIWTPCVAGYFKPATSTAVALCTSCLSGTYSDTTGATSCKICDGTVGNNGTTCTPNTTGGGDTVTLSYNLMGGTYTGGTLSTVTCDIDTSCALETNTNVYKAGYSLCGWSKTSNANCDDAEPRLTFSADDNGKTIYAIWSECAAGMYSDASSNGCQSCTNKTYSNTVAATSCTACPSNAYTNADGNGCYCDSGYYKNGDEANEYATVYSGDTCSKPESGGESGSDTSPASPYGASMSTQRTIYDSINEKYILIAKDTNTGICYATVEQENGTFSADLDSACIVDCSVTSYSADVCVGAVTLQNESAMAMAYSMRASNTFTFSFNDNTVDHFNLGLVDGKLPEKLYWLNSLLKYNNNGWELERVYGGTDGQEYYDKNGNRQIATPPTDNTLAMGFQEATNWGNICTGSDAANNIVSGLWNGEECSCPDNSTLTDGSCYCNDDYQAASSGNTCVSTDKIACDKLGASVATWQDNKCVCTDSTKVFQNGECGCDTAGNWTDDGNDSCVCKTDYYLVEGNCKSIESICSFEDFGIWDPYTNSCKDYEQSLQHRFMTDAACQDANGVRKTTGVVDGLDWCYCQSNTQYTGQWTEDGKCKAIEELSDIEDNTVCESIANASISNDGSGRCACDKGYYEYNLSCLSPSEICQESKGSANSSDGSVCTINDVEYRLSTSGTCSAAGSVNSEELVVGTWCNCLSDDTYTGAWADNGTCATKNGQCDADKHLEFDSSTNTCVCMSGYYMYNSICLTPAQLCAYDEDDGSWTDMGTCEFNGYFLRHMDNASCQSITNAAVYEGRLIEDSDFKHDTWCYCGDGYQWAPDSNTCIEKSFTEDDCIVVSGATWQDNQCVCTDNGKVFNGTACVCDEANGYTSDGDDGCQCASGYINMTDGELSCQTPDEVCKNDLHGSYENNTCKTTIDSGGVYVENAVLRYMPSTTCSSIDAQAYPDTSYGNWCYCGDGYQWNSENACELIKQPSGSDEALISACTTSDKDQNIVSGSWENSSCSCPENSILTTVGTCQCINDYVVHSDGQCKASTPSAPVCNGYGQEMDSDTNSCACKAGWIDNDDGGCTCDTKNGFEDKGNGCECKANTISLVPGKCTCDYNNGWALVGDNGVNCACNENAGFSQDSNGNCVCDTANGFSNQNGTCRCSDASKWEFNGQCWDAGAWCATNPTFAKTQSGFTNISVTAVDQNINLCAVESQTATGSVCDSSKACYYQFYIGADGACDTIANATESPDLGAGWCYCNDGYEWDGKECSNSEENICESLGSSVATWNGSACVCKDTTKVFQNGECVCDDDYIDQNGTCIEPSDYCYNTLDGSWYDGASICVYTNANDETKQLLFANDDCDDNHTASKYTDDKVQYGNWCVCEEKYAFQGGICKPDSNQSNADVPVGNLTYYPNNGSDREHSQINITFLNFTPADIDDLYTNYGAGWHYAGHRFLGWSINPDATEADSIFTFDIGTASENTLYAVWQECSGNTYKTEEDLAAPACAECPAGTEVNSNHSACDSICKGTNVTWVDGSCECSAFNKVYSDTSNQCVCNGGGHWVAGSADGNVNGCVCDSGYTLSEDKQSCEVLTCDLAAGWTPGWTLPIEDRTNECVCDSNRNYVLNSATETCGCDRAYPYEYDSVDPQYADGIMECYDAAGFCAAINGDVDTETGETLCKISGVQYMMRAAIFLEGPTCPTGTEIWKWYGDNIALCKCPYEWKYDTEAGWKCIDPATQCPAGSAYDEDAQVCKCDTTLYEETPVDNACVCKWETYNGTCSTPSQVCEDNEGTWTDDDDDADKLGFCKVGDITYYQSSGTIDFCSKRNATLVGALTSETNPVGAGMWCMCDTTDNPRLSGEWGKDASGNYVCVEKTCNPNEILNDLGGCSCDEARNYGGLPGSCACKSDYPYEYDGNDDGALECHSVTDYCVYSGGAESGNYCNKDGSDYLLLTEDSSCPTNAGAFDSDTLAKWCACSGQYEWVESNGEIYCNPIYVNSCDGVTGNTATDKTGACYCTDTGRKIINNVCTCDPASYVEVDGVCKSAEEACTEKNGTTNALGATITATYGTVSKICALTSKSDFGSSTSRFWWVEGAITDAACSAAYANTISINSLNNFAIKPSSGTWCTCASGYSYSLMNGGSCVATSS